MDDHLASEKVEKIETNVSGDAPNEGRNETGSCTSWRGRLFFIEVYMTLALLLYMNSVQIVQQYIFQTLARETLSNTPNYTAPNESICLDQDLIVSATGSNDSIIQIQQKTNSLAMYLEIVRLGLSAVMALIFGSLSDIVGRKPVQAICLFGLALCCGVQVAVIELQLNMYILIAAAGINGCFGGLASILGVSFAAVSDVTSKKWRTLRMGTTESAIGFGKMSSYLMVYYWINYNGCDFKYPAYSLLGIASLAFIYLMCLPESLPPKEKRKDGGFKRIASGAYVFVNPRFPNWVKVWVCVALISIQGFCAVGMSQIINYYLHNKPLEWTYDFIGIYGLVTSVSHIVTLIVVLPLLMALPIPEPILNPFIIVFAALVAIGTNAMMATVKTDWEMFVAGIVQSLQQLAFPASNSILSGLVKSEDYGVVLTVTASIQLFASVGSAVLFNEIYHPETKVNGHHYNPGIIFWISAGCWAVIIPLIMLLFKRSNEIKTETTSLLSQNKKNYKAIN